MSREYNYTEEIQVQIAKLRESGKPICAIAKEYGIAKSTISKWHRDYTTSGSFKAAGNVSNGNKALKLLQKENKRLKMEVDIFKQAALMMRRNVE